MTPRIEALSAQLKLALNAGLVKLTEDLNELTIECKAEDFIEVCIKLRDHGELKFEQLIDLCGVDYSEYNDGLWEGPRYAVVLHLLSVSLNQRVRLRVFATDDHFPVLPTLIDVWPVANWFER
ncbi:MAG: NADH-quinone oxidoreductase subunit C, partial [Methylophilaceae bacterium]